MPQSIIELPLLLTEQETSQQLRLPIATLREWRWKRRPGTPEGIPHVKMGKLVRYERSEVLAYVKRCREIGDAQTVSRVTRLDERMNTQQGAA